jgi:hypothetical protein
MEDAEILIISSKIAIKFQSAPVPDFPSGPPAMACGLSKTAWEIGVLLKLID